MKKKILIADDEESIRFTFKSFLEAAGYQVATVDSLSCCIKSIQSESFDLLFLDVGIGRDDGIDAIPHIKEIQPRCSIVVITGDTDSKKIVRARKCGAEDYVVKPIHQASLLYIAQKTLAP